MAGPNLSERAKDFLEGVVRDQGGDLKFFQAGTGQEVHLLVRRGPVDEILIVESGEERKVNEVAALQRYLRSYTTPTT